MHYFTISFVDPKAKDNQMWTNQSFIFFGLQSFSSFLALRSQFLQIYLALSFSL